MAIAHHRLVKIMRNLLRHGLRMVVYGGLGALIMGIGIYLNALQQRPPLQPWHTARLDSEFTAQRADEIRTLDDYLELEDTLFRELDAKVYANTPPTQQRPYLRYETGSLSDPRSAEPDWNRTRLLVHPEPRGAVLLLHGLSDSPYSMHEIARIFQDAGFTVLSLRLPGHGTAPTGLFTSNDEDWMAATRLAMRALSTQDRGQGPLLIAGYSTGAALAVEYAAAHLEDEAVPPADGLVLFSAAIAVSPLAALASPQAALSTVPGLQALGWTDIQPEYDPYKYNSFTLRAATSVYDLTRRLATRMERLEATNRTGDMPPIIAFQSVADATVSAPAVYQQLFARLPPHGHELVAFDINRSADIGPLLKKEVIDVRKALLEQDPQRVDFTLVTNESPESFQVIALRRVPGGGEATAQSLGLSWPPDLYSLAHVAIPFPSNDRMYGATPGADRSMLFLGEIELRGERGLLSVSAANLLRIRHNPFFPYLETRLRHFINARLDTHSPSLREGMSSTPAMDTPAGLAAPES